MYIETPIERALRELKEYGAEITPYAPRRTPGIYLYQVRDNGIWGLANEEPDMILDEDEILELHETYVA